MTRDILTAVVVPLSILIPICTFLPRYKTAGKETKTIFFYLIFAGLVNAVAIYLSTKNIRNLPLLHLYTIGETVFLLTYFLLIFNNKAISKILYGAVVLLPIAFIINFLFFQSIYEFNTYTRPVEAILITAICLIFLYKSGFVEDFLKQPKSWINIGILIYFPTATIIFILSNYFVFVSSNRTLNNIIWDVHSILVLAMYLAFAKGFSLIDRKTK